MEKKETKEGLTVLFFDDGSRVSRKTGVIKEIKEGLVFFQENNGDFQSIPVFKIVRIIWKKSPSNEGKEEEEF